MAKVYDGIGWILTHDIQPSMTHINLSDHFSNGHIKVGQPAHSILENYKETRFYTLHLNLDLP